MQYLAMYQDQVLAHTLSSDIFATKHALNAYVTAYEFDNEDVTILTLNQNSLDHVLKTHSMDELQFDAKYSVQYYQDQLNHYQQQRDAEIKEVETDYIKAHPIRFASWVYNLTYVLALPGIAVFSVLVGIVSVISIIILVWNFVFNHMIVINTSLSNDPQLTSWLVSMALFVGLFLCCTIGLYSMRIYWRVSKRNAQLEQLTKPIYVSYQKRYFVKL